MEFIAYEEQKETGIRKVNEAEGACGTPSVDQHMHHQSRRRRREKEAKRTFEEIVAKTLRIWKIHKFMEIKQHIP